MIPTSSTGDTFQDVRFSSLWIWIELYLLGTAVSLIIASLYARKMSHQSTLHKRNILITNGASSLSQALCDRLIETYKCRVVLLVPTTAYVNSSREFKKEFECNLSNRQQLSEMVPAIEKQFGPIELVIHQDRPMESGETDYVDELSNTILGFINLLTCFIPSMLQHGGGRIISIKNSCNNAQACSESQPKYEDLVQSIYLSQAANSPRSGAASPESIRFSTIFCEPTATDQQSKLLGPSLNLSEDEIASRILSAIESEQTNVQVHARRNLLEFCSSNIVQLAAIGLDKLQLRKGQKIPIKVQ